MSAVNRFRAMIRETKEKLRLRKYTPWTIAKYFREQGATIGEDCYIGTMSLGTEPYLVSIGRHVAISSSVAFITHDGGAWIFRDDEPDLQSFGPIVIEDCCMIGHGAILLPNIRIGRNSIIGAGSVVINDIPPNSIAVGNPARPFGSLERYRERLVRQWAEQKPAGVVVGPGETWWNAKAFPQNRERLREHLLQRFRDKII